MIENGMASPFAALVVKVKSERFGSRKYITEKKTFAACEPSDSEKSLSEELKCPIMNTKNVRSAEREGDENDENKIAIAVIIVNSKNIRKIADQAGAIRMPPPT